MKVSSVSENACLIQVGDQISESLTAVIAKLSSAIEEILGDALIDLIPSYTTLLCIYDLNKVDDLWMLKTLRQITQEVGTNQNHEANALESLGRLIELPVWYDPEVGYDLEAMANDKQISHAELIQLHTAKEYRVFASGFMPGKGFVLRYCLTGVSSGFHLIWGFPFVDGSTGFVSAFLAFSNLFRNISKKTSNSKSDRTSAAPVLCP